MVINMQQNKNEISKILLSILKSPLTLISCVLMGGVFGYLLPTFAIKVNNLGDIYLRLLKVCVIPIIFTAISSRIGEMLLKQRETFIKSLQKFIFTIILGFLVVCITGSMGYFLTKYVTETLEKTKILKIDRTEMGKMIDRSAPIDKVIFFEGDNIRFNLSEDTKTNKNDNSFQITIKDYFPENIFEALTQSYAIQIVIFSILLGITIGFFPVDSERAESAIFILETIYEIFLKMVKGILILLPVGLFFMIGSLVADQQEKIIIIIKAMGAFIISFYIFGVLIVLIASTIIWFFSDRKMSLISAIFRFDVLMRPIITSMFTMNSFATMPVAIEMLVEKLNFEKKSTNLYMSLLLPVLRFGNAFYFIIATAFFAIIYAPSSFGLLKILNMSIYCCFISFSTIGTTSIIAIQPVTEIFNQFGLPSSAGLILLIAIDTLVDPMRTTLIVHCNTAVTAVMADKSSSSS